MTRTTPPQGGLVAVRRLAVLAALALIIPLVPLATAATAQTAGDESVDITLLHDTHFHGKFGTEEPADVLVERFAGAQRFATARLIASDAFESSDTVVVASGQQFPDALAGSYLAGLLEAPVLLVTRTTLPRDALDALADLDVSDVVLLGGESAIGTEVEAAIAQEYDIAARIFGATRYETAAALATAGDQIGTWDDERTGILATGERFPDALTAGSIAYAEGFPVLLTTSGTLHPAAEAAITELDLERVIIPGGPEAVSEAVAAQVTALGADVTRVHVDGGDRFSTAVALAELAAEEFDFDYADVNVATGFDFADALAITARAGSNGNPLLLTNGSQAQPIPAVTDFLADNACDIASLHVAGGTGAVSAANLGALVTAAGECAVESVGRYMALVQERKDAIGDNALFVGNGDDIAPSLESGVFEPNGIHMIETFNASPIDVNTFGNHEFDYGPDNLRELLDVAQYPYVTANVRDSGSGEVFGADRGVEEFVLFERDGVQVGVTGLGPQNMASVTNLGPDTEQTDATEALAAVVPRMQAAGADIVVVASHLCGTDARAVADAVEGVDAYVGDHCAEVLTEPYVSPTTGAIVSLAGDEFANLGELTLTYRDGEVVDHDFTIHSLLDLPDLRPLPSVQAVVDRYTAELDEQLNVVIGERTVAWDTTTTVIRANESAIGNFITDEMRAFHDADVAVQNSGGIRANRVFEPGEITRRDIQEILPFQNTVVKAELSGATLLEALERSVDTHPAPSGAFLQVSGMEFTFDNSLPAGDRVVSVTIGDEPLDPARTYTMATNDFTLGGGDNYTMFRDDTTTLVGSNEGPLLSTFIIQRIEARQGAPVTTDAEGRITAVGN
jgi:2',3'-cyclic-nucleotide 2'-phosphodiesterase/3'-nucleotidase